ncbi:hypothetical protein GGR52DRAFT_194425 [Hypoxylon sp. FL1284]|nr:hypothetical protein GGR52DRAFT_194425 [Hypoxylon sp. FL1284]
MCSTIWFIYRCGSTEVTVFRCADASLHWGHYTVCYKGLGMPSVTNLDEECHDCSQHLRRDSSPSPPPPGVLQERRVNLPTHRGVSPPVDLAADLPVDSAADFPFDVSRAFTESPRRI